ncbi:MAG: hypothetical protein AAF318_02430 [Pseudomonadota bacterium]
MASRAFFRCRACGEPVVAGAYRCPVCGIDFPAGTPGAPKVPDEPPPAAASGPPADDGTVVLDRPAEAPAKAPTRTAILDVRPADAAPARTRTTANFAPTPAPVAASAPSREVSVAVRPRRSKARGLAGTVLSALILIAGLAVISQYAGPRVGLPPVIERPPVTVNATDGWVTLPATEAGFVVNADGPFRLRIDGEVFTLAADQTVRVPGGQNASLRVVRAPATATARRQ